jgi:hypothetical protein
VLKLKKNNSGAKGLRCIHARISCARDRRALSDLMAVYRLLFRWFQVSKLLCTFPSHYLKYRFCDEPLVPKVHGIAFLGFGLVNPSTFTSGSTTTNKKARAFTGDLNELLFPVSFAEDTVYCTSILTVSSPSTHVFM